MKKIGITGSGGFIGWHLRCAIKSYCTDIVPVLIPRTAFDNPVEMEKYVSECDVIVHLAGLNRADEQVIYQTNISLVQAIISACVKGNVSPQIVFSSSTHVDNNTEYGRSKKDSVMLLRNWANTHKAVFSNIIIPNVFGEYGKPFYNSVIATFCQQIVDGTPCDIKSDGEFKIIYVQDVVKNILEAIDTRSNQELRLVGVPVSPRSIHSKLLDFKADYDRNIIPESQSDIDVQLFNTFRSFLFPEYFPRKLELKTDNRGSLFEIIKGNTKGQIFYSTTKPGITRGNHYHLRKIERFCVVQGKAEISLRRLFTDKIQTYTVDGSQPVYIDMPTCTTHNITNIGQDPLHTLFWSNEVFNQQDPDTYSDTIPTSK